VPIRKPWKEASLIRESSDFPQGKASALNNKEIGEKDRFPMKTNYRSGAR